MLKRQITEIEGKIPDISSLATKTELTGVENKIPDVSSLVKKTDYNTKITEIENKLNNHDHDKYIINPEFNTFDADVFNARLKRANLVTKKYFDNKVSSLDNKMIANKTKNDPIENELKKLKTLGNLKKSKGLSAETVKPPTTSDNCLTPVARYYDTKTRVKSIGSCLKPIKFHTIIYQ